MRTFKDSHDHLPCTSYSTGISKTEGCWDTTMRAGGPCQPGSTIRVAPIQKQTWIQAAYLVSLASQKTTNFHCRKLALPVVEYEKYSTTGQATQDPPKKWARDLPHKRLNSCQEVTRLGIFWPAPQAAPHGWACQQSWLSMWDCPMDRWRGFKIMVSVGQIMAWIYIYNKQIYKYWNK